MYLLKSYEINCASLKIVIAWIFVLAALTLSFFNAIYMQSIDGFDFFTPEKVIIALIAVSLLVGMTTIIYWLIEE